MSVFDLPEEMQEGMRDAARDVAISAARAFGFGGNTWTVERPTGAGVAAKTMTAQANVTALAYRQRPNAQALAIAGTPILADVWRLILITGELLPGDVITSAQDLAYRFGIADVEPWYEYQRCNLERVR